MSVKLLIRFTLMNMVQDQSLNVVDMTAKVEMWQSNTRDAMM